MFNGKKELKIKENITDDIITYMEGLTDNPLDMLAEYFASMIKFVKCKQDNEVNNIVEEQILNIMKLDGFIYKNTMITHVIKSINEIIDNKGDPEKLKLFYIKFIIGNGSQSIKGMKKDELKNMLTHLSSMLTCLKLHTKNTIERQKYIDIVIPKTEEEKKAEKPKKK
jgi:hypothetical protein